MISRRSLLATFLLLLVIVATILITQVSSKSQEQQEESTNVLSTIRTFYSKEKGDLDLFKVGITLSVFSLLCLILFGRSNKWKNGPPAYPYSIPWIGNAQEWGENPIAMIQKGYEKYGEIFRVKVLGRDLVFLVGSEAHEKFYTANDTLFNAAEAYKFTVPVFGKGVVYDVEPEGLIQQRKMVSSGLTIKRFKTYVGKIIKEAEEYFEKEWGDSGEVDLLETFNELTVLTSTRCLHGNEVRENLNKEFSQLYSDLDKGLSPFGFFFPNAPVPSHFARDRARVRMEKLFGDIIEKRKGLSDDEKPEDMLQTLIDSKYDDGSPVTPSEVTGMMIALMLAGQHTSNVTSTWTGIHLLTEDGVMDKVMKEQNEVWNEGELDFPKLRKMTYLQNVIKETLRLRPPIILVLRQVMKDWTFKGRVVPKGTLVCVSPAFAHRLPNVFKDPDRFDPERFGPERREDKATKYSYIAFSAGRHACIGEQFAYVQIKTIWSCLLKKYNIELSVPTPGPDYKSMVVGPKPPVLVKYQRRK